MAISWLPGLVLDPGLLRCARNDNVVRGPGTQSGHREERSDAPITVDEVFEVSRVTIEVATDLA